MRLCRTCGHQSAGLSPVEHIVDILRDSRGDCNRPDIHARLINGHAEAINLLISQIMMGIFRASAIRIGLFSPAFCRVAALFSAFGDPAASFICVIKPLGNRLGVIERIIIDDADVIASHRHLSRHISKFIIYDRIRLYSSRSRSLT